MRRVLSATRRKYTPEEKIRIVLEGFRREVSVNDLCRREGIKPHSYYAWTKEFMEAGKERLSRHVVRDATHHEVNECRSSAMMSRRYYLLSRVVSQAGFELPPELSLRHGNGNLAVPHTGRARAIPIWEDPSRTDPGNR